MEVKSLHRLLETPGDIIDNGMVELSDGSIVNYRSVFISEFSTSVCRMVPGLHVIYDPRPNGNFLIGQGTVVYSNITLKVSVLSRGKDGNKKACEWYQELGPNRLKVLVITAADMPVLRKVVDLVLQCDRIGHRCLNTMKRTMDPKCNQKYEFDGVFVYRFVNKVTGKFYVGSSGKVKDRMASHLSYLRLNKHHCIKLQNEWRLYPNTDLWDLKLESVESRQEALLLEQKILDEWWGNDLLLNQSSSATNHVNAVATEESEQRRLKSLRAAVGKKEYREKLSLRGKEVMSRPEVLAKLSGNNCKTARAVFVDDVRYCTVREAVKQTGLSDKVIRRKANNPACLNVRWESETLRVKAVDRTGSKNPLAKRVFVNGREYGSLIEAARGLGCGVDKLKRLMRLNPSSYYFIS